MTALSRLADKGYVQCDRTTRTNLYSAIVPEAVYKEKVGRSFLTKFYDNSLQDFVAALYDARAIDENDLDSLKRYIDEIERRHTRD